MSYLYLCLLVVQYLKIVNSYDRIEILMVSTALNILLVMRSSIVILYLIVFYDYTVYKKRSPQSDTSVHVCVFVLYIAVTLSSHFHTMSHSVSHHILWQLLWSFTLAVKPSGVNGVPMASRCPNTWLSERQVIARPAFLLCPRTGSHVQHSSLYKSLIVCLLVLSQLTNVVLVCRTPFFWLVCKKAVSQLSPKQQSYSGVGWEMPEALKGQKCKRVHSLQPDASPVVPKIFSFNTPKLFKLLLLYAIVFVFNCKSCKTIVISFLSGNTALAKIDLPFIACS